MIRFCQRCDSSRAKRQDAQRLGEKLRRDTVALLCGTPVQVLNCAHGNEQEEGNEIEKDQSEEADSDEGVGEDEENP